ncbi:hypothetical protein pETSU_104 [Edwardsiella phage pEt-SU]|uniref:Uncharacterized protein n=1 Tax=Edwardsiella phage pEt-SU TaxID=2562142 RepID=A0A4D6DWK0_9CAUD|nr:hypothetical protein HOV39_gp104 [Edwardsiella phage pEt-SU]QBZ70685.1 hypothetical protein pETSU_104 [Edwardsiella phage pEt-SU]
MIFYVKPGETYYSPSGTPFKVIEIVKHGQCCMRDMVLYENLEDTKDSKAGTHWVIDKGMFLKAFSEEKPNANNNDVYRGIGRLP